MLRRCFSRFCAASGAAGSSSGIADAAASTTVPATKLTGAAAAKAKSFTADVTETTADGGVVWTKEGAWSVWGEEFKNVDAHKYCAILPDGFLSARATTDIEPAEELLKQMVEENTKRYEGIDVRDPNSLAHYDGERPDARFMTMGDKVRAVSEFISGHLAHQISLQEWSELFDLQHVEMDLMYWLYVLHNHLISRRATSVPIHVWNRRREVLDELALTMFESWRHTAEVVMGRPPLNKVRNYIKDMYFVMSVNLEEALLWDEAGGDMMLLAVLIKFCPLPRPEDVPMYTYYMLVHYVRFHIALFDRIPDEEFAKGNFNFLNPKDPRIFQPYTDVELDQVIREWTADGETAPEQEQPAEGATEGEAPTA